MASAENTFAHIGVGGVSVRVMGGEPDWERTLLAGDERTPVLF